MRNSFALSQLDGIGQLQMERMNARINAVQEKERLNRVEDITELPKRIYKNNMFRHQVLLAQQARNYSREKERLIGEINNHRIPANRARIKRRIDYLDGMIKEYDGLLQDENK